LAAVRFGFHTVHFSSMFGGDVPLLEVIDATAAAGFDAIGVDLASIDAHVTAGGTVEEVTAALDAGGLQCSDVLVLVPGVDGDLRGTAGTLGALAEALGAPMCIAAVGAPLPWPVLVAALDACADLLADHGCRLAVEFTPYTPLATLDQAKDLCGEIGWDRAGLVLDSLHFFRSGAPWPELTDLQADQVLVVQWSDVPAQPPDSLVHESRNGRLLPGDGKLPLPELASAIRGLGYDGLVSAEVLSESLRRREPSVVTREVFAALTGPKAGWVTAAAG
jgi:sugar phosphate isomerase/epimerase